MVNSRWMGLPAMILGILTAGISASALLGSSYAWTSLSGIADIAGTIGGVALTLIGLAILQQWSEFAMD